MSNSAYERIVEGLYPGARDLQIRKLTGGVSAQVRALTFREATGQERTIVVRQHGTAEYKDGSGEAAHQQHALQQFLRDAGWPVPEPLGVDSSCQILDTPYTVMAFVEGTTDQPLSAMPQVIEIMADRLRALHALDAREAPTLPKRYDPRPEVFEFWMEGEEWEPLRAYLEGLPDTCFHGEGRLLHGDFWPGNLLWQGLDLVAILDWEDAAIGDPVSDVSVARQEMIWKYNDEAMEHLTRAYYGGPNPDPWRQALWDIYVGFAAWKYMGEWGLEPLAVAYMRAGTLQVVRAAREVLLAEEHQGS